MAAALRARTGARNRFGLWQDSALSRDFRDNGVNHPDDMSGPCVDGYIQYLRGQTLDMASLLKRPPVPPPPPSSDGATVIPAPPPALP